MGTDTQLVLTVLGIVLTVALVWLLFSVVPGDTYFNPFRGRWESVALPQGWQIKLGRELAPDFERELGGSHPNGALQGRVYQIGARLVGALHRWERSRGGNLEWAVFPFRFRVVASERVNAFALPGGPIYLTYGLLSKLSTDDQLAGVLGHELGHVVLRHTAQKLAVSLKANALVWGIRRLFGQDIADWVGGAAALLSLKYSRDQEREADRFGFELLCRAGHNPQGLGQVFRLFQQLGARSSLEILSTHPDPGNRIRELQTLRCGQFVP